MQNNLSILLIIGLGVALYKAFMFGRKSGDYALLSLLVFGAVFGLVDFGGFYTSIGAEWLVFWAPIYALLRIDKNNQTSLSSSSEYPAKETSEMSVK